MKFNKGGKWAFKVTPWWKNFVSTLKIEEALAQKVSLF